MECLGALQEDTMEGSMWKEASGRSLGSHDAAELVGGMCHGNGRRQETTRLHAISCMHNDGMEFSHSQSGVPTCTGSIPSRE